MKSYSGTATDSRYFMSGRLHYLDNLRAVAIIMVIGVHAMGYCLPLPNTQREVISFLVHTISVPVFFLVDGYLFARSASSAKQVIYLDFVKKSIRRLLMPWLIFTLLYTFARYVFELVGFLQEKQIVGHSVVEVTISAYGSVYAPQMYFLLSLFLIRLCYPFLIRIVNIKKYSAIILFFFCYYAVYALCKPYITSFLNIEGGQEPILHAIWGVQFYFIGIILFKTSKVFQLKKIFLPVLFMFLVALPFRSELGHYGAVFVQYLYLIAIFVFFVVVGECASVLKIIGKNTMGIYLLHAPIVIKGVSIVLNAIITVSLLNYVAILFGTFLVTFAMVMVVNRIPYGVMLFGAPYQGKKP